MQSKVGSQKGVPSSKDAAFATQSGDSPSDSPLSGKEAGTPSPSTAKEKASSNASENIIPSKIVSQKGITSFNKALSKYSTTGSSITKSSKKNTISSNEDSTSNDDPLDSTPTSSQDKLNVYKILEYAGVITTQTQLDSVEGSVDGANADMAIQNSMLKNEESEINTYTQDKENAAKEGSKDASLNNITLWTGVAEMAVGAVVVCLSCFDFGLTAPLGVMLMVAGGTSIALAEEGPAIMKGIEEGLTIFFKAYGITLSPLALEIISIIVLMLAILAFTVATGGLATSALVADTLDNTATIAADVATTAADVATTAAEAASTYLEAGLSAMGRFFADTFPSIDETIELSDSLESIEEIDAEVTLSDGASTISNLKASLSGFASQLAALGVDANNVLKTAMIAAALLETAVSLSQAVFNYEVALFNKDAAVANADSIEDAAIANEMESFIQYINNSNKTILNDVTNIINEYGLTESGLAGSDPLDYLPRSV